MTSNQESTRPDLTVTVVMVAMSVCLVLLGIVTYFALRQEGQARQQAASLEQRVYAANAERQQLANEARQEREKIVEAQARLKQTEANRVAAEQRYLEKASEGNALKVTLASLESTKSQLSRELETTKESLGKRLTNLQSAKSQNDGKIEELSASLQSSRAAANSVKQHLEQQVAQLQKNLSDARGQGNSAHRRVEELQKEVAMHISEREKLQQRITDIEASLANHHVSRAQIEEELRGTATKVTNLQLASQKADELHAQLRNAVAAKEADLLSAAQRAEGLHAEKSQLEAKVAEHAQSLQSRQEEHAKLTSVIETLQSQLLDKGKNVQQLRSESNHLHEELNTLLKKHGNATSANDAEKARLQAELTNVGKRFNAEQQQLMAKVANQGKALALVEKKLQDARASQEMEHQDLQQKLVNARSRIAEVEKERNNVKHSAFAANIQAKKNIDQTRANVGHEWETRLKSSRNTISEIEAQHAKHNENFKKSIGEYEEKIRQYNTQLREYQDKLKSLNGVSPSNIQNAKVLHTLRPAMKRIAALSTSNIKMSLAGGAKKQQHLVSFYGKNSAPRYQAITQQVQNVVIDLHRAIHDINGTRVANRNDDAVAAGKVPPSSAASKKKLKA